MKDTCLILCFGEFLDVTVPKTCLNNGHHQPTAPLHFTNEEGKTTTYSVIGY